MRTFLAPRQLLQKGPAERRRTCQRLTTITAYRTMFPVGLPGEPLKTAYHKITVDFVRTLECLTLRRLTHIVTALPNRRVPTRNIYDHAFSAPVPPGRFTCAFGAPACGRAATNPNGHFTASRNRI